MWNCIFFVSSDKNDPVWKRSSKLLLLWLPATDHEIHSQAETSQKRSGLCN